MRAIVNDCLRHLIGWTIKLFGLVASSRQRLRIIGFRANQKRLKRKYNIRPDTPMKSYGPEVECSIKHASLRHDADARFAITSGSTGKPKEILYTRRRLFALKLAFS